MDAVTPESSDKDDSLKETTVTEPISSSKIKDKYVDILMKQNAALEDEVSRLCAELDEATKGVLKRGYLFKYRDRVISFASQWGLRYFVLQGKIISYFADEHDNRPRKTIDLSNCIVRSEGTKRGGIYHVFSVYLVSDDHQATPESLLLRIITDNLTKHGILASIPFISIFTPTAAQSDPSQQQWETPQVIPALLSWIASIFLAYFIEILAVKGFLRWNLGLMIINFTVGILNLLLPCLWVWFGKSHPLGAMIYLFQSVIIWMKLISYAHANRDLRSLLGTSKLADKLDDFMSRSNDNNAKPNWPSNVFAETKNLEAPYLQYPRLRYVVSIVIRMLICFSLITFTCEQYIKPTLANSIYPMRDWDIVQVFDRLLVLSIPNTYVWLLGFYLYFHLYLNLFAELTRFGDRVFYKDWWNARTIDSYWRNWNIPVHNWMLRHLYYPLIRVGMPKYGASLLVFLVSALLHEVIISLPFRHIYFYAFIGMLGQVPMGLFSKLIDKTFDNSSLGNICFWCAFCVFGQPIGVLLYSYDVWKLYSKQQI